MTAEKIPGGICENRRFSRRSREQSAVELTEYAICNKINLLKYVRKNTKRG